MVTSSPFPTCSSPSQLVSIDAGLKSSEKKWYKVSASFLMSSAYDCLFILNFEMVVDLNGLAGIEIWKQKMNKKLFLFISLCQYFHKGLGLSWILTQGGKVGNEKKKKYDGNYNERF